MQPSPELPAIPDGPPPAVIIHGPADGMLALAPGLPVTLLSAPGAGIYGGVGWWRGLIAALAEAHPGRAFPDILDCGDAPGRAAEALRGGQLRLVLRPDATGLWQAVARMAAESGATLLAAPPLALDLADKGAERRLAAWLKAGGAG